MSPAIAYTSLYHSSHNAVNFGGLRVGKTFKRNVHNVKTIFTAHKYSTTAQTIVQEEGPQLSYTFLSERGICVG